MGEEPRVQRERSGTVNCNAIMGKVDRVRLAEKRRKGIQVYAVFANMKKAVSEGTHGADSVEGALGVLMSRGEEEQAQTFAASEGHKVASFCFLRGGKKVGHFDRGEKGGRAANSNGFNSVGNSAIGGKTFGTGVDNFNNSSESSKSF